MWCDATALFYLVEVMPHERYRKMMIYKIYTNPDIDENAIIENVRWTLFRKWKQMKTAKHNYKRKTATWSKPVNKPASTYLYCLRSFHQCLGRGAETIFEKVFPTVSNTYALSTWKVPNPGSWLILDLKSRQETAAISLRNKRVNRSSDNGRSGVLVK